MELFFRASGAINKFSLHTIFNFALLRRCFRYAILLTLVFACSCAKFPVATQVSQEESDLEAEQQCTKAVVDKIDELLPPPVGTPSYDYVYDYLCQLSDIFAARQPCGLQNIRLYVLPQDELVLTSLPPNIIVISRSLIDSDAPCGCNNNSALAGLLAHELCHLWFGHTQEKWRWAVFSNRVATLKGGAFLSNLITRLLPLTPVLIPHVPGYMPNTAYSEWYFESASDLFALKVLTDLRLDVSQYLHYWEKTSENIERGVCKSEEDINTIKQRIDRIRAYIDTSSMGKQCLDTVQFVTLNYRRSTSTTLSNYTDIKKAAGIEIGRQPSGTFAELLRSISFWKCAINQNRSWARGFPVLDSVPLIDSTTGLQVQIDGQPGTVSVSSIPLSINGFSSFVIDGYSLSNME